jgi:AraC-like DNA-binding protein
MNIVSQDEELMKKALKLIEENMENFDFTVDDLVQQIGMSRTVFFKKLKTLTGLAPLEFIRDVKMKHAADLIASGKYRVKEVAYLVGISDSKYFAKCFKNKYGLTPVQYKNQLIENN